MALLAPLALGFTAVAVPIVLMYVLKLRRQEQMVSSTMLWARALQDIQANAPWQRLRPNMLLLLQLIALVALVLALAAPAYSASHTYSGDLIVIVDRSYGMQARDVAPSRFAAALTRARSLAADLSSGSVMSVIGMGAQPQLAIAESADHGAIDTAVGKLRPSEAPPNFLAALSLASSLARAGQKTQVIVLTSRDSGIASLPLQVPFPVDVIRIGGQLHDLGITAFSARPGARTQAIARVGNFGSRTARSDLDLFVDGQLADVRPLSIKPGTVMNLFWTGLPAGARVLRVHLVSRDDVNADKSAWAVVPAGTTQHLLLVSNGDYFLQTALVLDPSVALSVESPKRYTPADASRFDLVIFDGVRPPRLPAAPALLIAPPSGRVGRINVGVVRPAGPVTDAATPASTELASILRYADLSDVHVALAHQISLPGWMQPLVVSNGLTLLAAGDNGQSRLGIIPFRLRDSDWPLRISFPVVLQNLVQYLAPSLTTDTSNVSIGRPLVIQAPAGARSIWITRPDGARVSLRRPFPPFTGTSQAGLYSLRETGTNRSEMFAVNFFPARPAAASGPRVLHLGTRGSGSKSTAVAHVSVAWLFALLGLGVLSVEWWYAFCR